LAVGTTIEESMGSGEGIEQEPPGQAARRGALQAVVAEAADRAAHQRTRGRRWAIANYSVGIPASLLAGAGGVAALSDVSDGWKVAGAVFALVGGALTGVVTTLNAGRKSEAAWLADSSLRAISREAQLTEMLDLERFTADEMREAIDDLVTWMNEVEGLPARPSVFRRWRDRQQDHKVVIRPLLDKTPVVPE
jgi:hypothetical protein